MALPKYSNWKDKAEGIFYGGIIGDAAGSPCEFGGRQPGEFSGRLTDDWFHKRTNRFGFEVVHEPGQHTDDGDMMLTLWRGMQKLPLGDGLIELYLAWANSGTYSLGANTRKLLHGHRTVKIYWKKFKARFPDEASREACQTNGHLMRCAPLALIDDDEERARSVDFDTGLTNPGRTSGKVAHIYVENVRALLLQDHSDPSVIATVVRKHLGTEQGELATALRDGLAPKGAFPRKVDGRKTKGWSLHGLSAAVHFGLHAETYAEGLKDVLLLGGDTDTNACIVGSLLGARFGAEEMRRHEDTAWNMRRVFECQGSISSTAKGKATKQVRRAREYWLSTALETLEEAAQKRCRLAQP